MRHKEADARLRNGHYLVFMHYSLYSHALYETHRLIILCAIFLSRARVKSSNMHPSNKEHFLGENDPKKRVRLGGEKIDPFPVSRFNFQKARNGVYASGQKLAKLSQEKRTESASHAVKAYNILYF